MAVSFDGDDDDDNHGGIRDSVGVAIGVKLGVEVKCSVEYALWKEVGFGVWYRWWRNDTRPSTPTAGFVTTGHEFWIAWSTAPRLTSVGTSQAEAWHGIIVGFFSLFPYFSVAFSWCWSWSDNESALFGYISGCYTRYVGSDYC
jgi:hypothetical protein